MENDSEHKDKKLKYFKEEGHLIIYLAGFILFVFLGYTYYSYFKLSE